jgi:hypothetical protein
MTHGARRRWKETEEGPLNVTFLLELNRKTPASAEVHFHYAAGTGGCGQAKYYYTRISSLLVKIMIMIDRQGGRRSVERIFVARDSLWRVILRGESLRGDRGFVERLSLWRLSVKRTSMKRVSPWRELLRG